MPSFRPWIVLAALVAASPAATTSTAWAQPFDEIHAFGDSFTDAGNFYAATGNRVPPAPIYWDGRFSDGPVWLEVVAQELGLRLRPSSAGGSDHAFAVALATVDQDDAIFVPSVATQVAEYLEDGEPGENDLFVIFTGHIDVRALVGLDEEDQEEGICALVEAIVGMIEDLADAGARTFLVPGLADLGLTPDAIANDVTDESTELCARFDSTLHAALAELSDTYPIAADEEQVVDCGSSFEELSGVTIHGLDVFTLSQDIAEHAEDFGIENLDEPAIELFCGSPGHDPHTSLFLDCLHLTALGHRLLARAALEELAPAVPFERGDADGDGTLGLGDVLAILVHLYRAEPSAPCRDAYDIDDDGHLSIRDPFALIDHLYGSEFDLPAPSGACGDDDTEDFLHCARYDACE